MGSGVSSLGKKKENSSGAVTTAAAQPSVTSNDRAVGEPATYEAPILSAASNSVPRTSDVLLGSTFLNSPDDYTDRFLTNCGTHDSPQQNSIDAPYSGRSEQSEGAMNAAEMFAHTALSLGMDNDDLLFNLMYFDEGQNASFGAVMNSVQSETLALHSENNTPYKLKPASSGAINDLQRKSFHKAMTITESGEEADCECAVCKDEIEEGDQVLQLPLCHHVFHEECLLRWINLQGWCPVCRAPIESSDGDGPEHAAITAGSTPDRQDASAANVREILRDPKHDRHHSNCKDEDYYHTRERDARSDHSSGASPRGAMSKPGPMVAAAGLPGFSSKLGGAGSPVVRLFDGEDELDIEGTVREDSNDFGRLL